ncbi:cytochrome P450 2J2-like [Podarcis raffonei]|uniref:cytochrome P450 2J2-like n=1 Tax=Podarcis raffonei TaxID=65483 RepID=UPI002329629C|nr:cytochrome P450 2J2-like [Podarcis raffonei]
MEISSCLAVLAVSLLSLQFLKLQWARRHFPPGPLPLPLLGTLWCFGSGWHQDTLSKLSKVYGKVFTIWVGHKPMIVVNGFRLVKQVLSNYSEETSCRVVTPFVRDTMKAKGILFSSGHTWKEQRRFGISVLRSLGLGRRSMEFCVQEEAGHMVEFFASKRGQSVDPRTPLFHAFCSVISNVIFGHPFDIEDKVYQKLIECIEYEAHFFLSTFHLLYEVFPWLMCRLPGPHQKAFSCLEHIHSFGRSEIRRHKEKRETDEPQDFIDFYLDEINKKKDDPESTFDEANLVHVIYDLFTAGTDTGSSTLCWALLFMVVYPDIQEKVQAEIDAAVTCSQRISYEDRMNLPYTNAVIHEIQRHKYVLLVGNFRQCAKDATIFGFPMKKDTVIIPDIASALYDPEEWETPYQFNPNHFLDKEGNFFVRDAFIPFSIGKRLCLGENLARMEIFLFFTNLLQAFTLRLPDGVREINTNAVRGGLAVQPYPYMICAVPRKATAWKREQEASPESLEADVTKPSCCSLVV